jgi:hypothetical protein
VTSNDLRRHLQPSDEQFVRGVDPTTAGLTLMAIATLRELVEQMFPQISKSATPTKKDHHA